MEKQPQQPLTRLLPGSRCWHLFTSFWWSTWSSGATDDAPPPIDYNIIKVIQYERSPVKYLIRKAFLRLLYTKIWSMAPHPLVSHYDNSISSGLISLHIWKAKLVTYFKLLKSKKPPVSGIGRNPAHCSFSNEFLLRPFLGGIKPSCPEKCNCAPNNISKPNLFTQKYIAL